MNINKTIKAVKGKNMYKKNNYKNHLDDIINKTDIQRFNPFSMLDAVHKAYALHHKINLIVTDKGCRSKRKRDYDKGVFDKSYLLLGHSDGKFRQKWIVGNALSVDTDRRIARIKGPEKYYLSSKIDIFSIYIVSSTCKLLVDHYDDKLTIEQLEKKLKQRIYAIDKKLKCNFKKDYLEQLFNAVMDFIRVGWRNYLRGGSFARKCGRPTARVTTISYRPRLFVQKLKSKEGQQIINDELSSKGKWDKTKKHNMIKSMTTYYSSREYTNNIKENKNIDEIEVIQYCMNNKPRVMNIDSVVMNNEPIVMHNYDTKPVHNLFKTKINTEHYSYYVRKDYKKINSISRKDKEKPQQPMINIGKYLKNYLDKHKNIY